MSDSQSESRCSTPATPEDTARYISDLARSLRGMADAHGLGEVARLLMMVSQEAAKAVEAESRPSH